MRRMRHSAFGASESFDQSGALFKWGLPKPASHFGVDQQTLHKLQKTRLLNHGIVQSATGLPDGWDHVKTVAESRRKSTVWKAGGKAPRAVSAGARRRPPSAGSGGGSALVVKDLSTPVGGTNTTKASRSGAMLAKEYAMKERPRSAQAVLTGSRTNGARRTNGSSNRG